MRGVTHRLVGRGGHVTATAGPVDVDILASWQLGVLLARKDTEGVCALRIVRRGTEQSGTNVEERKMSKVRNARCFLRA